MDYLNKLPVELWREIVSQIVVPFNRTALPDFVTLHPETVEWSQVERNQEMLWLLLPTSRLFCALIEPLLYREIYIETKSAYHRFLDSAKTPSSSFGGHRRGRWTKDIYIFDKIRRSSDMVIHLDEVLGACPNISHLLVLVADRKRAISWKTNVWSSNIRFITLAIPNIGPQDLLHLSNHCPGLTTLKLTFITRNKDWNSYMMTFPSLIRLSLSQHFAHDAILNALECPQLQTLYIQLSERSGIEKYLERHAATLIRLKIYPPEDQWSKNMVLPSHILHLCKGLQWLSFQPDSMNPISVQTPCERLVHLDLAWQVLHKSPNWKQHAKVFSSSMFLNLSLVTISIPSSTPNSTQRTLLRKVKRLFTRARVELNVDYP